jgi:hypothetical protein
VFNFFESNNTKPRKKIVLILSLVIGIFVFILSGLLYTDWWLGGCDDAIGIFFGYKKKHWFDLIYFFIDGSVAQIAPNYESSNHIPSFLSVYYRPIQCIYLTVAYWVFGCNLYKYLLVSAIFHAVNSVLLFNIFLWFLPTIQAILITLIFSFHPQIAYRFGAAVNFQYYFNVFLLLIITLLLKNYISTFRRWPYFLASCLFLLSLFTRETFIILPAMLILWALLFNSQKQCLANKLLVSVRFASGFILVAAFYLVIRILLYPINFLSIGTSTNTSILSTGINFIKFKFPDFRVFLYDLLWLSWLPYDSKNTKLVFFTVLFSVFVWFFINNSKKRYIIFFLACILLMFWPGIIGRYSPRYFYEISPFAIMMFVFLFKGCKQNHQYLRKFATLILFCLASFYTIFAVSNLRRREDKMRIMHNAFDNLINNPEINGKVLCFIGHPLDGASGLISMIWMTKNDDLIEVYEDTNTFIIQGDSNVVESKWWGTIASKYFDKNYLQITPVKGGFRFTSLDPYKVNFVGWCPEGSIGERIVHKREMVRGFDSVTDFTLIIDEKFKRKNPLIITWDYGTKEFKILSYKNID